MNCVRDMVISSEFFNISSYTRLISCLKVNRAYVGSRTSDNFHLFRHTSDQ